ncbi:hypothetical protein BHE74_00030538 [Ensete ventricosum]|nr:hypothetical protein BHE74_00030538 [Ensete ventricosum]
MDALEILDSNKEVVLKLLEDPNSHFYKQIEDRQKTQVVKVAKMVSENYSEVQQDVTPRKFHDFDNNKLFHKQSRYSFFWKKDKPKEVKSLKHSQNLETTNRVVVPKTNPMRTQEDIMNTLSFSPESHHKIRHEEEVDRVVSHFSLRQIKRRLKHIIGGSRKEGRMISRDGVLHRIPIGYKVSGGRDKLLNNEGVVSSMEKSSEVLPISKGKDSKVNPEEHEHNIRSGNSAIKPASPVYKEGKKHLVDMLDIGDKTASLRTDHVSRSLGRLLSIPEYSVLSPRVIPGSDKELVFPSESTGSLPLQQFNQEDATNSLRPLKQVSEISSCSSSSQTDEITLLDLKAELTDNPMQDGLCIVSDLNHEELLFDCIDEALEEIQEKFFKCTPWVSLITANLKQAPVGKSLIKEVSKRIEMHIPMRLPNTSDQIVTKDWECGSWMDLQLETENIVVEIWDTALDDLVEETIFDLWLEISADW